MGEKLLFCGPDAGRAKRLFNTMTTGDTGDTGETPDLREYGETVVAAVGAQVEIEDAERARHEAASGVSSPLAVERFAAEDAYRRIQRWDNLDLEEIPYAVWNVLQMGALCAFEAVHSSDRHDRVFDIGVIDDPYEPGLRALSVTCLDTDDSEDGSIGLSAPVTFHTVDVFEQSPDALARITELRLCDPGTLQGWWVEALQETAAGLVARGGAPLERAGGRRSVENIVVLSKMTNMNFPFPDASGRIRCPHGVTFRIVDTTAHELAVQEVRDRWETVPGIADKEVADSLEGLAIGLVGEALREFGDEGLVSGIAMGTRGVTVRIFTDDERHLNLPGIEILTAPTQPRLVERMERALCSSVTTANAAWARALADAVEMIAEFSPFPQETIAHVVERSTVMLAEDELALGV